MRDNGVRRLEMRRMEESGRPWWLVVWLLENAFPAVSEASIMGYARCVHYCIMWASGYDNCFWGLGRFLFFHFSAMHRRHEVRQLWAEWRTRERTDMAIEFVILVSRAIDGPEGSRNAIRRWFIRTRMRQLIDANFCKQSERSELFRVATKCQAALEFWIRKSIERRERTSYEFCFQFLILQFKSTGSWA